VSGVDRVWLGWDGPCIPAAARWLILYPGSPSRESRHVDLGDVVCVLPGKRAGRVLLEELLRQCEADGSHLVPPRIITPGSIADVLSPPADPTASQMESIMAWMEALRRSDAKAIAPLVPYPPQRDDFIAWHDLAKTIARLHTQLAGENRRFADAAVHAEMLELFGEGDRWRALESLHARYLAVLRDAGLEDSHGSLAVRLSEPGVATSCHAILIGIVELNAVQREALNLAERITSLIHAPAELCGAFDAYGCVIPNAWASRCIEIDDERIILADRPEDQAQCVMRAIAEFDGRYAVDEITIGLGDAALGDALDLAAMWAGLSVHRADGLPLSRSGPYRLLHGIATWLEKESFASLAALLRHPDLERWLRRHFRAVQKRRGDEASRSIADWISLLDHYFSEHLQARPGRPWLGDGETTQELKRVHDAVRRLLTPFAGQRPLVAALQARPIGEWVEPALDVLRRVYGGGRHSPLADDACMALVSAFASLDAIHPSLQPHVDAPTALRLALEAAESESLAESPRDDEIEALGWLELHLDPAPAMIVMGVNDGSVPEAITADAFLPDSLRTRLGLVDSATRYARDAYLLEAMLRSRAEMRVIAGRRAADGEPLTPSRLLLACERERLPQRIRRLCDAEHAVRHAVPLGAPTPAEICEFTPIPEPKAFGLAGGVPRVESMSVTSFRAYLQCPYRWWLTYIQRLEAVDDGVGELDPLGFGSLAHDVLEQFGKDEELRVCSDPKRIEAWLDDCIVRLARERYGKRPLPAVRVQLEQLRYRLSGLDEFQAMQRAEGWEIIESERYVREVSLDIPDAEPMPLRAKIDRIDSRGRGTDREFRIIDYKTGESAKTPFEIHHGVKKYNEEWLDLQLPLYRYIAERLDYKGAIEVGYVLLPRSPDKIAFAAAEWTQEQYEAGIEKAREVVRSIRAGEFWPPAVDGGRFDEFASICRTTVFGGNFGEDGEEGGE
jgi:ATP-dependent helicase/nuclease subunit B